MWEFSCASVARNPCQRPRFNPCVCPKRKIKLKEKTDWLICIKLLYSKKQNWASLVA